MSQHILPFKQLPNHTQLLIKIYLGIRFGSSHDTPKERIEDTHQLAQLQPDHGFVYRVDFDGDYHEYQLVHFLFDDEPSGFMTFRGQIVWIETDMGLQPWEHTEAISEMSALIHFQTWYTKRIRNHHFVPHSLTFYLD